MSCLRCVALCVRPKRAGDGRREKASGELRIEGSRGRAVVCIYDASQDGILPMICVSEVKWKEKVPCNLDNNIIIKNPREPRSVY